MPITTDKAAQRRIAALHAEHASKGVALARAKDEFAELRVRENGLQRRLKEEQNRPLPAPPPTPSLADTLAVDPSAALDEVSMEEAVTAHATANRIEQRRAAAIGVFQAAQAKLAPLIEAAEKRVADMVHEQAKASEALNVAVYDVLLDVAAERMKALASEVLLPLMRMSSYRGRGGYDSDLRLRLDMLRPVSGDHPLGITVDRVEETFFDAANAYRDARMVDLPRLIDELAGKATPRA